MDLGRLLTRELVLGNLRSWIKEGQEGDTVRVNAAERLIVALDVPHDLENPGRLVEAKDAYDIVKCLEGVVFFYKVGWPLLMAEGGEQVGPELARQGKKVFLDVKFNDIPETSNRVVAKAASSGMSFLTVHNAGQTLRAAVAGRDSIGSSQLKILSVTLLTSMNNHDLQQMGFTVSMDEYIKQMVRSARDAGCDGVVCSGRETAAVRKEMGREGLIVTPGIRPVGFSQDDHKRLSTPREAILAGADYVVVGRPILRSPDPYSVACQIIQEMQDAFDAR